MSPLMISSTGSSTPEEKPGHKRVFFATPSKDGSVHVNYQVSMDATRRLLYEVGYDSCGDFVNGDVFIERARNELVRKFLETDCTHIFFIDADTGWRPKDVVKMLERDVDIIAGVCRFKREPEEYPVTIINDMNGYPVVEYGMLEMVTGGTCFMCISRKAIELIVSKIVGKEGYMYYSKPTFSSSPKKTYKLFYTEVRNEQFCGEDNTFITNCKKYGIRVMIEPDVTLHHCNGPNTFTGNYHEFLLRQVGGSKSRTPVRPEDRGKYKMMEGVPFDVSSVGCSESIKKLLKEMEENLKKGGILKDAESKESSHESVEAENEVRPSGQEKEEAGISASIGSKTGGRDRSLSPFFNSVEDVANACCK